MTLGQNIKKLRRNADMTQEELAEMLSISSQAVSRWEVGTAMPDISLLPSLCNIFNVSSDVLLGIDSVGKQAEIDKVRTRAHSFSSRGYFQEARAILEDGLQKFPNDYFIIRCLLPKTKAVTKATPRSKEMLFCKSPSTWQKEF